MKDKDSQLIWETAQIILDEGRTSVVNPDSGNDLTDQYINPKVTKYIDEWILKTFKTDNVYDFVARELFKDIELTVTRYEPDEGQGLFGRSWRNNVQRNKRKMEEYKEDYEELKQELQSATDEYERRRIKSKMQSLKFLIRNDRRGDRPEDYRELPGFGGRDTGLEYLLRKEIKRSFGKIRSRLYNMWNEFREHLQSGRFSADLRPVMTVDNHDFDEQIASLEDVDGRTWPSIEDKLRDTVNSNQTFNDDEKISILSAIRR